ncbi:extended synaptotagmin-2 isoform X2 [Ciona intestinalis]
MPVESRRTDSGFTDEDNLDGEFENSNEEVFNFMDHKEKGVDDIPSVSDVSSTTESDGTGPQSVGDRIQTVVKARIDNTIALVKLGVIRFFIAVIIWLLGYFNFSILWIVIGVWLAIAISERMRKQKQLTEVLKNTTESPTKFIETLKELYRSRDGHLPSWIYFPDVEKAEWLNKIIQQVWPYLTNYVKKVISNEVQSSVQNSSSLLSSFSFTDINLGCRAPRVAGVKVYDDSITRRNEVVMDIQIVYDSECNCGVSVNRLQAGICDLRLRGLLRVEFHPLIEDLPLIGAVSVGFVNDPFIDFNLTDLANLFDLPGFNSLLRGAISDSVCGMMVLPDKYVIKLCPDIDISRLRFPLPQGVIRIHVIEARNLEEKDKKVLGFGGGSDPYVTVQVGHRQKFKTAIINHNLNPVWNEVFDVVVPDVPTTQIQFSLFDDDGALNKSDNLGMCSIPVKSVFKQGIIDEWVQLSDVSTGAIHVRLEFYELSSNPKDLKEALDHSHMNDKLFSSFLNIYVDGAQNLPEFNQECYDANPQLKITLPGKEPLKTRVAMHTNNPVWEENFHVLISHPELDLVTFQIKRKDGIKSTLMQHSDALRKALLMKTEPSMENDHGNQNLGFMKFPLKHLLRAQDMTIEHPFTLKSSGPSSVLNMRLTLRILKLKSLSESPEAKFTVHTKPNEPTTTMDNTENTSNPPSVAASEASEAGSSFSRSTGPTEFVDPTLKSFFEGIAPSPSGLRSHSSLGRTSSVASEISNVGEISNLRKRLNARVQNSNNIETDDNGLGRLELTIRYYNKHLVVVVLRAANLIVCDDDEKTSDPYVRVYILPDKRSRKKTKVIKNNLNPVWDQRLEFDVSKSEVMHKKLHVSVKNQTGFLSSEKVLMGQVIVDLSKLDLHQPTTEWYSLQVAT